MNRKYAKMIEMSWFFFIFGRPNSSTPLPPLSGYVWFFWNPPRGVGRTSFVNGPLQNPLKEYHCMLVFDIGYMHIYIHEMKDLFVPLGWPCLGIGMYVYTLRSPVSKRLVENNFVLCPLRFSLLVAVFVWLCVSACLSVTQ